MASQLTHAQQHFRSFQIDRNQSLGHGAYGAVYKAKCDQLPCAAKILHPTILDPMDPGADRIRSRFRQECALLERIRHPNIVQYLAMTVDPESRQPVLLMELLDESLTKMLERSPQSLAYYIQVDICHDVALAISYLHSNNIIHRDLSSNNVLIIAGRRAKVTDFGMSKLAGAAPTMTPLTMCPGTLAYMPPEALREPPRYTKKLDCFSEGVVMIQVCTRLWPEPGPRTEPVQDTRSPTGTIEMPVLEPERRRNHIDLITPYHAFLPIIMECLKYHERERPSSEELCQSLAGLKESTKYRESLTRPLDEILVKDDQIIALKWRRGGNALFGMSRGDTVVDGGVAYFMHCDGRACSYNLIIGKWSELPKYLYQYSSLAVVNGQLTAIGGCEDCSEKQTYTNKLLSLRGSWSDVFPPMPTKRRGTTAITSKEHLIVAGGATGPDIINTVEVMDTKTLVWSVVADLPHPFNRASATVCGDNIYLLGGVTDKGITNSVLTCSLTELLQSSSSSSSSVWHRVADAPAYWSTCAAVKGQLLAFGGRKEGSIVTVAIHEYSPITNSWVHISDMLTATTRCLVAVLPTDEIMAVGGAISAEKSTNKVQIATVTR